MAEVKFQVGDRVKARAYNGDVREAHIVAVIGSDWYDIESIDGDSGRFQGDNLDLLSPVAKPEPGGECMLKAGVRVRCVGLPADWDEQGRVGKIATLLEPTGVPETWRVRLENGDRDNWAISPSKTRVDVLPSEQGAYPPSKFLEMMRKRLAGSVGAACSNCPNCTCSEVNKPIPAGLSGPSDLLIALRESYPASWQGRCSFCQEQLGSHTVIRSEAIGAQHRFCFDQRVEREKARIVAEREEKRRDGPDPYGIRGQPDCDRVIAASTLNYDKAQRENRGPAQSETPYPHWAESWSSPTYESDH